MQMPNFSNYIEKEIISKRFILAISVVGYYLVTGNGGELVGAVMGFYFGEKAVNKQIGTPSAVAYVTEEKAA